MFVVLQKKIDEKSGIKLLKKEIKGKIHCQFVCLNGGKKIKRQKVEKKHEDGNHCAQENSPNFCQHTKKFKKRNHYLAKKKKENHASKCTSWDHSESLIFSIPDKVHDFNDKEDTSI